MPNEDDRGAARAFAARLAALSLALIGGGFAWFAWIDAPITDAAMLVFAVAVAVATLALVAALVGVERSLAVTAAAAPGGAAPPGTLARRIALLCFIVALALMVACATLTLNLKGTGGDDADTQTVAV